jgi:hypothetical protein
MKYKVILFLLVSNSILAQNVRPLFGLGYNWRVGFSTNAYYNINTGLELSFKKDIIRPEVEVSYFLGGFDDKTNYDNQGILIYAFSENFTALNFVLCPKIILFRDEDTNYYVQLLPKYNLTKVEVISEYLLVDQNNNANFSVTREVIPKTLQSFGFGAGLVADFSKKKSDSIAFNLYYHHIDFGQVLSLPNHSRKYYNTKDVLAFEVIYYFNLRKK